MCETERLPGKTVSRAEEWLLEAQVDHGSIPSPHRDPVAAPVSRSRDLRAKPRPRIAKP